MKRVTGSAAPRPESVEDTVRLNDEFTRLAMMLLLAALGSTPALTS